MLPTVAKPAEPIPLPQSPIALLLIAFAVIVTLLIWMFPHELVIDLVKSKYAPIPAPHPPPVTVIASSWLLPVMVTV